MSFDAENRNNINIIITNSYSNNIINDWPQAYTGRIINGINNINNINRCSFCDGVGHNIRTCADTRIADFEEECQLSKTICDFTEEPRNSFKDWIIEYYLIVDREVVKAFAIRKCNCRIYSTIDTIIANITNYIYGDQEETDTGLIQEFYNLLQTHGQEGEEEVEENVEATDKFSIATTIEQIDEQKGSEICECAICYEDGIPKKHSVTLNCKHKFCKDCFKGCLKSTAVYKDLPTCALCRADISAITVHSESVKGEFDDYLSV
jgi:hypothetical protein